MVKLRLFLLISMIVLNLWGCAVNYVDQKGAHHTWGFVHMIDKALPVNGEEIANLHQVKAFGLYYLSMQQHASVGVGYVSAYEISVSQDQAVDISLDPLHPQSFEIRTFNAMMKGGKTDAPDRPSHPLD